MKNVVLALCAFSLTCFACGGSDDALPNASLSVTTSADLNHVAPAQGVPMTAQVQNVYLVAPDETPPPEQAARAAHLEFYFDDEATPAVLVTAETSVTFPIPASAAAGPHEIICRVHKHDDTPTSVVFVFDVGVTLEPSVTATSGPAATASTAVF